MAFLIETPAAEKMALPVTCSNQADGRGRGDNTEGRNSPGTKGSWKLRCHIIGNKRGRTQKVTESRTTTHLYLKWESYTLQSLALFIILSLVIPITNTHQPFKWTLIRIEDSKVLKSITTPGTPSFQIPVGSLGPYWPPNRMVGYYMCPSSNPGKGYCNSPGHYYCAYWGCETVASEWHPQAQDQFIKTNWGPAGCKLRPCGPGCLKAISGTSPKSSITPGKKDICSYIYINITKPDDPAWLIGKVWGIRLYVAGTDPGSLIQIKKEIAPHDSEVIGPNQVAVGLVPGGQNSITTKIPIINQGFSTIAPRIKNSTTTIDPLLEYNTLWKMIKASYNILNQTHPDLTKECWLCYSIKPPYYEAMGYLGQINRTNGPNPQACKWGDRDVNTNTPGITLASVTGKGVCIGTIPPDKLHLCNRTIKTTGSDWLVPAANAKWVCKTLGVTPCISVQLFNSTHDYCVQVIIVPRIIYHSKSYVLDHQSTKDYHLTKREPITALTIAVLLTVGGVGAGTGITSLVTQKEQLQTLRMAVDEDILKLERSIDALVKSVRSLSEVVLQNRKGLDILFMQQGGLCVALKEQCCTYVDYTGVAVDTMAELRKQIEQRKQDYESQQSWYETWFNRSPWLTTMLSTIMGPLILLVAGLTFGPCIFNRLITIVKSRLEAAHLMLVRAKYDNLGSGPEDDLEWSRQELKRFIEQNKDVP